MRNRMETKMSRRLLSLALSAAMVLSLLPVFAFAEGNEGLCEHHPAHTPECGYVAAVAGQDCAHVCGDDCFTLATACTHVHEAACYSDGVLPNPGEETAADACTHVCTEESGCVTKTPACVHTAHDEACGYVAAVEGQPCGYVCAACAGEPQPEDPTDKVITGWAWVDPDEWLDETGSFAMPGVTEDTPAYFEDVVEYLPTQITADGETLTLGDWVCDDYPMETGTAWGDFTFETTLPEGYVLSEGGNVLRVNVTIAPLNLTEGPEAAAYDTVTNISYLDADGTKKTADCTAVTADYLSANNNTLSAGWYVVQGDVTIGTAEAPQRVTVSGDVHLILADRCNLIVNGGIQVQDNSTDSTSNTNALTLYAQSKGSTMGKLTAQNVNVMDAAIGGGYGAELGGSGDGGGTITINGGVITANSFGGAAIGGGGGKGQGGSGGTITISGGVVQAESTTGAAIGGGYGGSSGGSGGTITISGGIVEAKSFDGAAIGGGRGDGSGGGSGGTITISGGIVEAKSSDGAAIGGGHRFGFSGRFSTGTSGNAVIFASSHVVFIADQHGKRNNAWRGIIFEGGSGAVYGDQALTSDMTIAEGETLTVPTGTTLTIQAGVTLTNNGMIDNKGTIVNNGTIVGNGTITGNQPKVSVKYLDADGTEKTAACTAVTADYLSANNNTLSAGWYVAQGNVIDDNDTAIRRRCNGDVNLILEDGCNLYIYGAIDVSEGNSLTIYAQSTGGNMGKLTVISGSSAYVDATDSGAGIGSADLKNCGNITINGGIITTVGSDRGAGIGSGGYCGGGGNITISGGIITTVGSDGGAGIGDGNYSSGATFSTGASGNPVIFTNSISDKSSQSSWSGVIFEGGTIDVSGIDYDTTFIDGGAGKVYGNPALPFGLPIPKRSSLTLDMNGKSLTFTQGTGITLNSGSTLKLSGPGSFPNGISVSGGTLGDLLAEGWAFTQNGKCVPVSDETSLSGATSLSRITVKINTQPADVTMTYGEAKSLSVTAEPVTSGSTVSYQWYLDGSALTGETQSTLSLSTLNVGTYQIYCAVTCGGFTVNSDTATVTVGKAASSVTFTGDPGKTYDGQSVSMEGKYTITGTGKVEYKRKDAADSTYTTTAPKDAGNYTVRVTAAEDANHTAASETKDFTITPKTVTLTVTVKDKPFDDTTTAEIDTVNTNGIVAGDDVQVASGTPSFTRKTPGENIPVSFTEFKLEGTDAGNYQLTQPTGVTGKILPTTNYLDLAGYADFDDYTEVWVDGVAYPIQTEDNRRYAVLPEEGDLLTIFTYKSDSANLSHENYPTGMAVYTIDRQNTGSALERITEFDDLLQYSGCSIRVTGKRGIRMITALTKDNKKALKGAGLAGYTLAEYGTVVQWADTLGNNSLTLGTGKHNYAYKKGVSDPVFANVGDLTQYTNVLVWESLTDEQLGKDIVMRPYIILKDADDNTVTLYGGCVSRSIGYIAYQNRDTFKPGTAAYEYVWGIIKAVYKNDPDIMNQYQGKGGN